jgi:hypothetical protein
VSDEDAAFTQRLRDYQKALEEEWEQSKPSVDDDPEELARKTRKLVINSIPQLVQKANLLALGATSESVSLQAIRFLYQIVVPNASQAAGAPDPMDKLIEELTKKEAAANSDD